MILDLFAGPGGWSEGLRMLGLSDIGLEWDAAACQTRAAAGHRTVRADISVYPAQPFADRVWGLIASPPCQDFSMAGKRAGRTGEKGQLIDVVPYWVAATRPRWIACEQVPPALPVWREHAEQYRRLGYSVWTGILNAANYGVPQTRKRAFLLASLDGSPLPPAPTHAKNPTPGLFGVLEPWISMAEALGWGLSDRPAFTFCGSNEGGPDLAGGSGARSALKEARAEGAWVVDRRTNSKDGKGGMVPTVTVGMDRPSPTLTGKAGHQWVFSRPATTIVASFRPDIVAAPGWRGPGDGPRQNAEGSVKITPSEAGILQSFPADYPWQGPKGKQFEQAGNAVPPLLAAHVIGALTGRALERAA